MYKILTVVGARPQFIKAAPLSGALAAAGDMQECLVHTGQHYDDALSGSFFRELPLPTPAYHLEVGSGRPAWQMGQIILRLDAVVATECPDAMVVFGDTNSTAAAAVVAAKNHIPLVHVEAGLREFDRSIPEEINKLLTDSVTDLYCCPTQTAIENLRKAGITEGVFLTGDIGIDLIRIMLPIMAEAEEPTLKKYGIAVGTYAFATCHRAANTENREALQQILTALACLSVPVIFPLHPRTRKAIEDFGLENMTASPNLHILPPLGFVETQVLARNARCVITDSGGLIKEAYLHKTPGIIIDCQTEWVETVREGWNTVAGPHAEAILRAFAELKRPVEHSGCLGDGQAAARIVNRIHEMLDYRKKRRGK